MNIVIVRSERYTVKILDLSGKNTALQSGMNCLKYWLLLEQLLIYGTDGIADLGLRLILPCRIITAYGNLSA